MKRLCAGLLLLCLLLSCCTAGGEAPAETPAETATPAPASGGEILRYGMKGDSVRRLQERLIELGYLESGADGEFGRATKAAVKAFQKANQLDADGEAGPATLGLLFSDEAVSKPLPPDPVDTLAGEVPFLVNKDHPLTEDFVPANLVLLSDVLDSKLVKLKSKKLRAVRTAAEALRDMLEAARADKITKWQISTAYRTWEDQESVLNRKINSYLSSHSDWSRKRARSAALRTVALPGQSEHQLGLAFDINVPGTSSFKGTRQCTWLHEHCWEYGFIIRYTKEKKSITGFDEEAWHIRYVGIPHALRMRDMDLCLEEYVAGIEDGTVPLPGAEED